MDEQDTISTHIRLETTLEALIEKARRLDVPFFQTFFVLPSGKSIQPSSHDCEAFLKQRHHFDNLYLHAPFWINLCSKRSYSLRLLEHELNLAKKLKFTHLVLHPGSAHESITKDEGIDILASSLNKLLKKEHEIVILLENTAHGNMTVGNDLQDFEKLMHKLDYPIGFCFDTAHAYVYGYDLVYNFDDFMKTIESTLGFNNVQLLHLNDTPEPCGSKKDTHAIPGAGNLGKATLQKFITYEPLRSIPIIIEFPNLSEHEEKQYLHTISQWRT